MIWRSLPGLLANLCMVLFGILLPVGFLVHAWAEGTFPSLWTVLWTLLLGINIFATSTAVQASRRADRACRELCALLRAQQPDYPGRVCVGTPARGCCC